MADKIVVLRAGRIEQVGTPQTLYEKPCNTFVAGFIGSPRMNFMPVHSVSALAQTLPPGTVQVGVRPEHWVPCAAGQGVALTVTGSEYLGAQRLVHAQLADGTQVELLQGGEGDLSAGQTLHMQVLDQHIHAFGANEQRLERTNA